MKNHILLSDEMLSMLADTKNNVHLFGKAEGCFINITILSDGGLILEEDVFTRHNDVTNVDKLRQRVSELEAKHGKFEFQWRRVMTAEEYINENN